MDEHASSGKLMANGPSNEDNLTPMKTNKRNSSCTHMNDEDSNVIPCLSKNCCGPPDSENSTSELSFLKNVVEIILKSVLVEGKKRSNKIIEFHHPDVLQDMLDLELGFKPTDENKLIKVCEDVAKYSVKTGHPHFFNQLWSGVDQFSLAGSWMTDALNTSQYTYEVAPVFTLLERTLFAKMLSMVGFEDGDAIFCPGGSMCNMYAMNIARYNRFPESKQKGMQVLPDVHIYASEKAHYSMLKGAALLGFGTDAVVKIKCDSNGKMLPSSLQSKIEDSIKSGYVPWYVCATAGTTVHGAYDPLEDIAHICKTQGVWMHVDGAWGASALLSKKYRYLMNGVHRADSLTWNPHKMMGPPLQASVFLTKHKGLLAQCHSSGARYLFQQDKFYDVSYDTGDMSLQCGRKVDVLKVWLLWKAKGDSGYDRDITNLFDCTRYLASKIRSNEGFKLISEPEACNVCFWYIPPSMRGQDENDEWFTRLSKVAPQIKQKMVERGTMMIGYQPDGNMVNFFRMIVSNLDIKQSDMDFVVEEIDRLGSSL